MRPEAAVRLTEYLLESAARHRIVLREQNAHGQSHPMLKKAVERRQLVEARVIWISLLGDVSVLLETPAP